MALDTRFFYTLNSVSANPLLDALAFLVVKKPFALGAGAIIWLVFFFTGSTRTRRLLVLSAAAFVAGDVLVFALKGVFARVRPCHALEGVRLLTECPGSYSMPSRHAAGIFSVMAALSFGFKRYSAAFLAVAFLIAFSRVYSGVHYPADVLAGAALGAAAALLVCRFDKKFLKGTPLLPKGGGRGGGVG